MSLPLLLVLLVLEGFVLYLGQRYIFGAAYNRSKFLTYLLVAPGTALHELSHWIMCIVLRVPTDLPVLFRPEKHEDGSMTLGYVQHAKADPFRGALVAIAPVLLVPLLLLGIFVLLFSPDVLQNPFQAVQGAAIWKIALAAYLTLSAGTGAFPSPGDHIGVVGGIMLIGLAALAVYALGSTLDLLRIIVFIWSPAAFSALILLLLFNRPQRPLQGRRRA